MDPFTSQITLIVSALAVLGQIFILFAAIAFVTSKETPRKIAGWFAPEMWLAFAFMVAGAAVFGSLYYSQVVGFVPCQLCWFQRIFIYPQFVLLGIALFRRDFQISRYSIPLALLGVAFSLVHYYEQMSGSDLLSCGTNGASCTKIFFTEFGYVTFPMIGLTASLLIIVFVSFASLKANSVRKNR